MGMRCRVCASTLQCLLACLFACCIFLFSLQVPQQYACMATIAPPLPHLLQHAPGVVRQCGPSYGSRTFAASRHTCGTGAHARVTNAAVALVRHGCFKHQELPAGANSATLKRNADTSHNKQGAQRQPMQL
jgi:hypothetical protein